MFDGCKWVWSPPSLVPPTRPPGGTPERVIERCLATVEAKIGCCLQITRRKCSWLCQWNTYCANTCEALSSDPQCPHTRLGRCDSLPGTQSWWSRDREFLEQADCKPVIAGFSKTPCLNIQSRGRLMRDIAQWVRYYIPYALWGDGTRLRKTQQLAHSGRNSREWMESSEVLPVTSGARFSVTYALGNS